jgi:transcriptional regulator with XRE-family HTH domain
MASPQNNALRTAIFQSGQKQIDIAKKVGIHESRLSKLARGHLDANDDEKRALARVLRKPIDELFPEEMAAS